MTDGPDRGDSDPHNDRATLTAAFGGRTGLIDAGLPGVLFVLVYTLGGQRLQFSLVVAVGAAVVLSVVRLVRGGSIQYAVSGFFGVALAAFIASRTGRAEDFYLPSLWYAAGYGTAMLLSILVRWPAIGVILGLVTQSGFAWRLDPVLMRAYRRATWVWVAMFAVRIAVLLPLYLAGWLAALGTARVAVGVPLWLVVIWITYRVLRASIPAERSVLPPKERDPEAEAAEEAAEEVDRPQ